MYCIMNIYIYILDCTYVFSKYWLSVRVEYEYDSINLFYPPLRLPIHFHDNLLNLTRNCAALSQSVLPPLPLPARSILRSSNQVARGE